MLMIVVPIKTVFLRPKTSPTKKAAIAPKKHPMSYKAVTVDCMLVFPTMLSVSTLILPWGFIWSTNQCHICCARNGDPEGQPSAAGAEVSLACLLHLASLQDLNNWERKVLKPQSYKQDGVQLQLHLPRCGADHARYTTLTRSQDPIRGYHNRGPDPLRRHDVDQWLRVVAREPTARMSPWPSLDTASMTQGVSRRPRDERLTAAVRYADLLYAHPIAGI
jgi:hypothetical protein